MNARTVGMAVAIVGLGLGVACASMMEPGDDLSRKVDHLRADVEALTAQQQALAEEIRKLQGPSAAAPAPPAAESEGLAGAPAALYQRAYDLLMAGKFKESQEAFAEFIRRFPQSDLADNAQYWIGESFYGQKEFRGARDAFQAVADHFPFGNKVPDALYKQALCEGELGDKAAEKKLLSAVAEQYSYSEAAGKARDLLKKLG